MNELIKVNYESDRPTVSARELHEFLQVLTPYDKWFPRMCEYGFSDGEDFSTFLSESTGGRPAKDAQLTIDMAKEICMIQRNERGRQARQYFIQLEKDWNSPEKVMARALQLSDRIINSLRAENSALTVKTAIMAPKAEYFDALVDRESLLSIRETAKAIGAKEKEMVVSLIERRLLYRDQRGKLLPYANTNCGYFEVKECTNDKTGWCGVQTMVTVKGREAIRRLMLS